MFRVLTVTRLLVSALTATAAETYSSKPIKWIVPWVEAQRHTPSVLAQEVQAVIDSKADIVILAARSYDEYHTMSIPAASAWRERSWRRARWRRIPRPR